MEVSLLVVSYVYVNVMGILLVSHVYMRCVPQYHVDTVVRGTAQPLI